VEEQAVSQRDEVLQQHRRAGTERVETVVVGGGQAGLAVGYHLARRGRRS
jgi:ribulose 1,5-bisphosphate synthetase/thiazole synthase